jgi:hypothetical protein
MRRAPVVLWLVQRDPTLVFAAVMAAAGLILVPSGTAGANSIWLAFPVFLAVLAFLLPVDPYQSALPIRRSEIVLARILAVLATIWLPLAAGFAFINYLRKPWGNALRPAEFGVLLTAAILLAWVAYAGSPGRRRWGAALPAAAAGLASLALLPWAYAGAAAGFALIGIWVAVTWRTPQAATGAARSHWLWPLLKFGFSWRQLAVIPFAACLGLKLGWSTVPVLGFFLTADKLRGT